MANLTYRAERALLGALLHDPDLLEEVRFLAADDFMSRTHRDVFTAITSARADYQTDDGPSFDFAVALAAPGPGLDLRYLESLGQACPDPANAATYARMVMEASLRRQLLSHAERLFRDAGDLHFEVGRFSQAAGPGHGAERFPSHLMKLAHAMWVHAKGVDSAPDSDSGHSPAEPEGTARPGNPVIDLAGSATARGGQPREEEEVLADLIQHYWQNSHVLEWLPAEAFTPGPRRGVYEAITALSRNSEPVDELTVEWQMASQQAARQATIGEAGTPAEGEDRTSDPGYVGVLAALPVADGTATMTGRVLLNRHTAAQLSSVTNRASEAPGPGSSPQTLATIYAWPRPAPARRQPPGPRRHPAPNTPPPPSFGATSGERADPPALLEPPRGATSQPDQPGPRPRR
jgi:hypothetical protein